jgi:acetyl-CoA C-acetyltransferase
MLWDPIHFLESCPSSDGACAMVLADEANAKRSPNPPAWVLATAMRSELGQFPGRDPVRPRAGVECSQKLYEAAGITDPRGQIDVAELYVPFSWYEPMWLEGHDIAGLGEGWRMVEDGSTEIGGDFPVDPSGGVLSSNPIGASGMLRFAEAALQVRGMAGEHQVEGATVALGHAYGGAAQYFAMWIVGSTLDAVEANKSRKK